MPRSSSTSQSVPTPRQSHWNSAGDELHRSRRSCSAVSPSFLPSVSRIACRWVAGDCSNSCSGGRQPAADRRAAARDAAATPPRWPRPGSGCRPAPCPGRRVDDLGQPGAGDDREPGAVGDLVDRGRGGLAGRGDLGGRAAHRAGAVDDDRLTAAPASPPPACPAPAQVTVTIACTSVAPSGRYSFWKTSAVQSAIRMLLRGAVRYCLWVGRTPLVGRSAATPRWRWARSGRARR